MRREQLVGLCQTGSEGLMLLYRYRTVWGVYRLLVSTRSITRCMLLYFPHSHSRHQRRALHLLCRHLLQHGCVKIRRESNNQKSWSSAAHMGSVQARKWVACVRLSLFTFTTTASLLLFTRCYDNTASVTHETTWTSFICPLLFFGFVFCSAICLTVHKAFICLWIVRYIYMCIYLQVITIIVNFRLLFFYYNIP